MDGGLGLRHVHLPPEIDSSQHCCNKDSTMGFVGGGHNSLIRVVRGSVLDQDVDAVVNAANTRMRGGGGIDGRVHQLAGPKLLQELQRVAPHGAETAEVVVTPGFQLKQSYIFHVAGPVWRGGTNSEEQLLTSAYRNCVLKARDMRLESLAFCSLSTGAFGYPLEQAAPVALDAVSEALEGSANLSVTFAMFGQAEFQIFCEAFQPSNG